jgi:type II secretory pathway pseudopilin PulG
MQFRLWTILYVFALVASAMATFGPWGIVAALAVLAFWAKAFYSPQWPMTTIELFIVIAILGTLVAILLPAVQTPRESGRRDQCMNNLKNIAYAVLDYESTNGTLPAAHALGRSGTSQLSWRELILPFIERRELYEEFDLIKSWNAPENQSPSSVEVDLFHCPSDPPPLPTPTTNYFAVIGPQTVWSSGPGRELGEIRDGKSETILLMEAVEMDVPWAQPKDLSINEAIELLTKSSDHQPFHLCPFQEGFYHKSFGETGREGIHVAMADGQVRFLVLPLPQDLAMALLTVDGGEPGTLERLEQYSRPQLDYAKCFVFGVSVVLSLLPAVRLFGIRTAKPETGDA